LQRPLAWLGREPKNLPSGQFASVRYAPIGDQIPHRSELTLCAKTRPEQMQQRSASQAHATLATKRMLLLTWAAEIWRPWRTRQCGIEDTAAPSPRWRRWSSPEAACGAPKAQGLRNVATSVIIRSGLLRSAVVDLPSI